MAKCAQNIWNLSKIFISILLLHKVHSLPISEVKYTSSVVSIEDVSTITQNVVEVNEHVPESIFNDTGTSDTDGSTNVDLTQFNNALLRNEPVRPGMSVSSYSLEITPNINANRFAGRLTVVVAITDANTREEPIVLHMDGLSIQRVMFGLLGSTSMVDADYDVDDEGHLLIFPSVLGNTYSLIIDYEGDIRNDGTGLYQGFYDDGSYLAMNLYPTHARRVFPCVDEPDHPAALALIFVNSNGFNEVVSNSINEGDGNTAIFTPLLTTTHLWGLVAHNFVNIVLPADRVRLYGRSNARSQEAYASVMTSSLLQKLNEYTEKPYFEIDNNAEESLHIFAMPDITRDWMSLASVGIWEPHILMNQVSSIDQRKTALVAMASAYARQWFGYVIYPENWKYSWITVGFQIHVAYELAAEADLTIDMNAVFASDIVQESLYLDGHSSQNLVLQPEDDLYDENQIRDLLTGVMKYKAPALMRMLKYALGDQDDYMRSAASALLNGRSLQGVTDMDFEDAVNGQWAFTGNGLIGDFSEFLEPWLMNTGYPVIQVSVASTGDIISISQTKFSYTNVEDVRFNVPLTYATRINPNFDNVYAEHLLESVGLTLRVFLDEEDWIIFNVQRIGYYRVEYDFVLWERIVWALEDPDQRAVIHPLNRAQLVDDSLNLARAGRLDYETAFHVVLTMEHETDYSVWKAYIKNMDFLRKRLIALDPEEYKWDIYWRMVRRTIGAVENSLTFTPDVLLAEDGMDTLTRGLVMDHACRSLYQPCIAAAIDWFYASTGGDIAINPNIPNNLRPAVFCTVVREGGPEVREWLWDLYETEEVEYERLVILESLGCSQDLDFISSYLLETISPNARFGNGQRSRIFKAIADSSLQNAGQALGFLQLYLNAIVDTYGGREKLEEIMYGLIDNLADHELSENFIRWVTNINTPLDESSEIAQQLARYAEENLVWIETHLENVYEWIDENDASGLNVSLALLLFGLCAIFFNY